MSPHNVVFLFAILWKKLIFFGYGAKHTIWMLYCVTSCLVILYHCLFPIYLSSARAFYDNGLDSKWLNYQHVYYWSNIFYYLMNNFWLLKSIWFLVFISHVARFDRPTLSIRLNIIDRSKVDISVNFTLDLLYIYNIIIWNNIIVIFLQHIEIWGYFVQLMMSFQKDEFCISNVDFIFCIYLYWFHFSTWIHLVGYDIYNNNKDRFQ